ncbi:MAG: mandelate racemase/muconate lactonizing enzyme family protein [Haloplanus sp.]
MGVIADVVAIPLELGLKPLDEGGLAPYVSNHDVVESRERMLIRVETEAGTVGWGEFLVIMESASATKAVVEDVIAPELIGRETTEIRDFVESFYYPYISVDPFLGGVEMALWDVLGKELGAPVHQLLGGAVREEIPVAYCLGILEPDEAAEYAARAHERGFSTLKTKAGHDWREDVERMAAMYDAVDGEMDFRLDPNQGWSPEETVRVAATLEDAGIYLEYLEQPQRVASYGSYHELRSRIKTPLAVNEDTYSRFNLHHLIKADAIDVAVVDIVPGGGIVRTRELAALATHADLSVSHHSGMDFGIKTAAVLQTIATTPAIDLAPDSVYYAWEDDLLETPLPVTEGTMTVPDDPGLGITVDEAAVERYRMDS